MPKYCEVLKSCVPKVGPQSWMEPPGNLAKIPTPADISSFLQIIWIANQPLQPWLLINMYMPSHEEDLPFIPNIQNTISDQINVHPDHTYIPCGDFNRDVALIGRQNDLRTTPPQPEDYHWRKFTDNLDLTYITTNTIFSRQGWHNCIHNSLIDGFFIKTPKNNQYISTTNQDIHLNSDHLPIQLHIPPNALMAKITSHMPKLTPRILNPIPKENLKNFHTQFFETNSNQINELIQLLEHNDHLTEDQWHTTCTSLDTLISNISTLVLETCSVPPILTIPNRIANQGATYPRNYKRNGKTTFQPTILSEKTIYTIKNNQN